MCRILFAVGEGKEIRPLLMALVKSAEDDPYRERRNGKRQHADGWGYVLLKDGSVRHYRSERPVFRDDNAVESLEAELEGFVLLMVHARAASQGDRSLYNVQPFAFSTRRGFSFWLMHNGDLDKGAIIELAGLNPRKLENISDTYAFATYICRRLPSVGLGDLLVYYRAIGEHTKSIFNTITLFHDSRKSFSAFITARMGDEYLRNQADYDYAKLLMLKKENLFAVASSTLELYHRAEYEVIPNETVFYVKVEKEGFRTERVHL